MKFVSYLTHKDQLEQLEKWPISDLLFGHQRLSRFGSLNTEDLLELAKLCRSKNIQTILEWDLLQTPEKWDENIQLVNELLSTGTFLEIRVQDLGAAEYVKRNYPEIKIQLSLEASTHNLKGIQQYEKSLVPNLSRLILSVELPADTIQGYLEHLKTPIELLALGPILLYNSPRSLLTPNEQPSQLPQYAWGKSEESVHKGFFFLQNSHGTYMFNTKDLFILDKIVEMSPRKPAYVRIDLRFGRPLNQISELYKSLNNNMVEFKNKLKELYQGKITSGLFKNNKTTVLFPKLKNSKLIRREGPYLGDVLDSKKGQYTAILLKNSQTTFRQNDLIEIQNPLGKNFNYRVSTLKNGDGENIHVAHMGQIVVTPYIKGAVSRSKIYKIEKDKEGEGAKLI